MYYVIYEKGIHKFFLVLVAATKADAYREAKNKKVSLKISDDWKIGPVAPIKEGFGLIYKI